jgi:general secretion pathway protein J
MSKRDDSAGFTLLELLIAVAIVGLIVVGLSAGLRFDLRALASQQLRVARYAEVDAVATTMRGLVAEAHGVLGTATRLSFTGALPAALDRPGLFDVRIALDAGRKLTLSWTAHRPPADENDPGEGTTTLLDDVAGLELAYYTIGPDKVEGWQSAAAKEAPPKLVRIRLRFAQGDRRHWPDLIARPWASGTSSGKLGGP